jgi:hypothetical protein
VAPCGTHFIHEFSRSSRVEISSEALTDFRWLRIEPLHKATDIIAVTRQMLLKVVQFTGEDRLDDALRVATHRCRQPEAVRAVAGVAGCSEILQ